ncbi:MAG: hypothetical protein D9V47_10105 [Clostridia bacterium]|nr:MAG: hypothetical protein D9V47_10105 [Clostridia bacterium]
MVDGPLTQEEIEELVALIKEGKVLAPAGRATLEGETGDSDSLQEKMADRFPNKLGAAQMLKGS